MEPSGHWLYLQDVSAFFPFLLQRSLFTFCAWLGFASSYSLVIFHRRKFLTLHDFSLLNPASWLVYTARHGRSTAEHPDYWSEVSEGIR